MTSRIFIFLSFLIIVSCHDREENTALPDLTKYVDPQIGSVHGRWFFYTPAAVPFGMAKLAPHTNAYNSGGGWGPTGYDDRHLSIEGFGHFHEFQVGGLTFMPTTGTLQTTPGSLDNPDLGYRSRFDKEEEFSEPGYYRVFLKDYQIAVELTATERAGFQRYKFQQSGPGHVIIDLGHRQGESGDVLKAYAKVNNEYELEGYIETYPEYLKFCDPDQSVRMYFVSQVDRPIRKSDSFVDSLITENATVTEGTHNGLVLNFDFQSGDVLNIKTGLSYTSIQNARNNLTSEAEHKTFEVVREEAQNYWNEKLNRIQVTGGKEEDRIKFYTGLYHALLGRGLASDVNGQYPKIKGEIGQIPMDTEGVPLYRHFNTDGMWGGFWNLSLLWALVYPEYLSDYVQANIDLYKDRGWLHDGVANSTYTNGVQTNFQGLILASAYHAGIRDFDLENGYAAALKNEMEASGRNLGNGKYDLHKFLQYHYIPYEDTVLSNGWVFNFGSSHTLEYSFSSYAVGQMAQALDDTLNYRHLMDQANYYQNLFDPVTKLMRPRRVNGQFIQDFEPMKAWDGFQEGNAWQYTWYVPQDPATLYAMLGDSLFNGRLESMFEDALKNQFGSGTDEIHSFSAIEKLYNHGNQPSLHNAWLFNYSGKPWLTQKWVQSICRIFYGTTPLHGYGVGQDEDQGQLGAWYVMSSMGLFDVQGHSARRPTFQFGSPLFDSIRIKLNPEYYQGDLLEIVVDKSSEDASYIQSLSFNQQTLDNCWMFRDELLKGGTLKINLAASPNKEWGTTLPPPSMSNQENYR
ncbi:MAG: GH92 family glycosyl hydrolase [Saprospiraceae bacterium]|nr:GH92 family glycosyl hydrolase [Saprospiraceae bacterium]